MRFSCDLCGKEMAADDVDRYVARIDIRPANFHLELTEDDLDADHLAEVGKLLEEMESNGELPVVDDAPVVRRLDLCACCKSKFEKDPLAARSTDKFHFSKN
jgi:hypothetical protein